MIRLYKIIKYFTLVVILFSLCANVLTTLSEGAILGIFSLRNLFLLIFACAIWVQRRWSLAILILISVVFWYQHMTSDSVSSFDRSPVTNYTFALSEILGSGSRILKKVILSLPIFSQLLITLVLLPIRIFKLKK